MLAPDDNTGIMTYLVGLIILVMAAVGFSAFVDRHSKESGSKIDLREEISTNVSEIAELTQRLERSNSDLTAGNTRGDSVQKELAKVQRATTDGANEKNQLAEKKVSLQQDILTLEKNFDRYQEEYRRKTRLAAVGEKLGNFTVRDGREFAGASIARVTDAGLEIRHEHGMSRLAPTDLDPKFQERFQWSEEGRLSSLEAERKVRESMPDEPEKEEPVTYVRKNPTRTTDMPERTERAVTKEKDSEQIQALRRDVTAWRLKVSRIRSEKSTADYNASASPRNSVPGSLETWSAKASRLTGELSRAQSGLSMAKAKLADIAPSDLTLREPVSPIDYDSGR